MNITQMHDRLRQELPRRIQRGTLSVSLLARQTGFGQSHLSNFLRCRRQLSLKAMDRILAAQHLTAADLLPAAHRANFWPELEKGGAIPMVSHTTALFDPQIRPSAVQSMLHFPANALESIQERPSTSLRRWHRFVALRATPADALPMDPLVQPEAIVVIDRHYNLLVPYRPNRQNLYAVRHFSRLTLHYVDFLSSHLVLRPHNLSFPVELIEVDPGESP